MTDQRARRAAGALDVQVVCFDGFDLLDALAPFEVLVAGADAAPGRLRVRLVSADGTREVRAGLTNVRVVVDGPLVIGSGLVLVPGAAGPVDGDGDDSVPAILARTAESPLAELLAEALERDDAVVATVCGGSLVLAMAGLIDGRPATTHHLGMPLLDAVGVRAIDARIVDDGDLISAGSVTSGLDLGLYLLDEFVGPEVALSVERLFAYERRGTAWRDVDHTMVTA